MSLKAFKEWIAKFEDAPTVSVKEAKSKWAEKKKQLQNLPGKSFYKRSPEY